MFEKLIARVEALESPQTGTLVRSPAVGILEGAPDLGVHVSALSGFARLRILNQRHALALPLGIQGFVAERFVTEARAPVEFNQPIVRLSLSTVPSPSADAREAAALGRDAQGELIAVTAPSEGVFYLRPKPDAEPYVSVGSAVASGSVLGLVEVMKCFNPITYGGPGLPGKGVIAQILAGDAAEVEFGQVLFLVKPGL
jgi:acetyl-CoA carboxylase biotin carboxyl carrier protein